MSSGVKSTKVSVFRDNILSNKLTLADVFDSYIKNLNVSDDINCSWLGRSITDIDILPFSRDELRWKKSIFFSFKMSINLIYQISNSFKTKTKTYLYWPFLLNAQQSPYSLVTGLNKSEQLTNSPSNWHFTNNSSHDVWIKFIIFSIE